MEPIPLFPKPKDKGNHDTSYIIREAFQDILGDETIPKNVSKNIIKYNTENASLKNVATNYARVS